MSTLAIGNAAIETIRADFPALHQEVYGHPLVYLDNAATTQRPRQVIQEIVRYYEQDNANIHRGMHALATRGSLLYEGARERVARFIGASRADSVIFTRNTTEALNLLAYSWGDAAVGEGDEIVLTVLEHHSNVVPWQLLAHRAGARLRYVPLATDGSLDMDALVDALSPRTRAIAVTQASNVTGALVDIAEVATAAREVGARVFVDGAQGVPHLPTDVAELGCDALAFSAHKMLGPTGVGALWVAPELLESMPPFLGGGSMIGKVLEQESTWAELPHKFEAGTPNIADVVAFTPALDYLERIGMDAVRAHEVELTAYALDRLRTVPGLSLPGPASAEHRTGVVSFVAEWGHPHDISTILDQHGVAVRAGHHCAQPLMRFLDVAATTRASFYIYNSRDEVDVLVEGLLDCHRVLGGGL